MPLCEHEICVTRVPLFSGLDDVDQVRIHSLVRQHEYPAGAVIFQEGDAGAGLYVLRKGRVKLFKTSPDGKEQLVALLRPGDFFGERTLLLGETLGVSAQAIEPSHICLITRPDFASELAKNPTIALQMAKLMAERLEEVVGLVGRLGLADARERLAAYLASLADGAGRRVGPGVEITLPANRREIAGLLGMTPETLSRRLHDLMDEGVVRAKGRRTLVVKDLERLRAEGQPQ